MLAQDWIEPHPTGIYVKPCDAWIDPSVARPRALVTHGHADHARGGHGAVWATPETLSIMGLRYGVEAEGNAVPYGEERLAELRGVELAVQRLLPLSTVHTEES